MGGIIYLKLDEKTSESFKTIENKYKIWNVQGKYDRHV